MGTNPNELDHQSAHPLAMYTGSGSEGIDVGHISTSLRENRRVVFGIAGVLFAVVMISTALSHMEFQSLGRLYLGELDGKTAQKMEDFLSGGQGDVYNEIEILRSTTQIKRAILQSGVNVSIKPAGWEPPPYWKWMLSRRDPALIDVAAQSVIATDTVLLRPSREPQVFTVEFGKGANYSLFSKKGLRLASGELGAQLKTAELDLTLLPGILGPPTPGARYEIAVEPIEETIDEVLRKLEVGASKGSTTGTEPVKVLTLTFSNGSPRKAATFLERLMLGYLEERQAWKTEDARAAEAFVTQQLNGIQRSLQDTDEKLAEFRTAHPTVVQESQAGAVVTQLGTYEQQRIAARLQVASLRTLNQKLQQRDPPSEAFMVGVDQDPMLQNLAQSLSTATQRLSELSSKFYDRAPEVVQQRAQVQTQLAMIRNYVSNRLARSQEQVGALDGIIKQYQEKLSAVPGAELGLAQIGRDNEVYSRMYSYLLERQQQSAIVKASTVSKSRILDEPQIPRREYTPKLWQRLVSALLGLLLGGIFVVARSLTSKALRSESEVRSLLSSTVVFAHIPRQVERYGLRSPQSPNNPRAFDLLANSSENGGFAEAFRTLRTNLYFAVPSTHGKVILITSPSTGDGKTTTTMCLAALLAADNKRVLTIDADIRKPSHHLMTGFWPDPGLRSILDGSGDAGAVHSVSVTSGVFDSICAGLGGKAELLSTQRLSDLLVRARHHYDYVLLDSASYPLVSDALLLARQSDFVISVMRIGSTPRRTAEEHMRGLVSKSRGHAVVVNSSDAAPFVYQGQNNPQQSAAANAERLLGANTADGRRRV